MNSELCSHSSSWLDKTAPEQDVVVSSRVRLARNLTRIPFATFAKPAELIEVLQKIGMAVSAIPGFANFQPLLLTDLKAVDRKFLKESHVISPEMEKPRYQRLIYVSSDYHFSLMLKEEDHLRLQGLMPGLQIEEILRRIVTLDEALINALPIAFSPDFGFLTACPTNLGTGLRVSVMMHLPGLALLAHIEKVVSAIQPLGITVRGFYGENSEFMGDLYQISNEISLGKTEEEITRTLMDVVKEIIGQEKSARQTIFHERSSHAEDLVWRSFGLLSQARTMSTEEAMSLLSRIRLGIDRGYFKNMDHSLLNKLIIDVQPAHVESTSSEGDSAENRGVARAAMLRSCFHSITSDN